MVLIPRGIGELGVHKFQWLDLIFQEDRSLGCDANPKVQDFISVVTPAGVVGSACSHLFSVSLFPERCYSDSVRGLPQCNCALLEKDFYSVSLEFINV